LSFTTSDIVATPIQEFNREELNMFGKKQDLNDPMKALDKADKTLNSGLTGALTKGFMGKDFVNKMNQSIDMGKSAIGDMQQSQLLAQTGMDATAEVLSIQDTGVLVNYNPVVVLQLKVTPTYGAGFETTGQSMVSKIAIPRIGDKIKIKYNPANPTQILVM
jgi:hypothetical protein